MGYLKYSTMQITKSLKKRLFDIKCDLKLRSFEDVINLLLKTKNISFILEREGRKREISGVVLYDKLRDGWKIISYKTKGEDTEDEQPDTV